MSVSLIILTTLIIIVMMGAGQRILDQLRLNDKQALLLLLLIAIGLIIPPIWFGDLVSISIGGFIIPFLICVYLLVKVGFSRDLVRAIIGSLITMGIIYGLEWIMPADPEELLIDPMFIYGVVAGLVAYILGRSRRNAYICAVFGVTGAELLQFFINLFSGTPTTLGLGTGGAFGTLIVSIIVSVATAEFFGRAFESANPDKEEKKFNFETGTYDSKNNGKLATNYSNSNDDYKGYKSSFD
ncbi:MAG: DUF1614 domain-containing protein, partial [bacterium]|nr:DUF1614 domain-containing protein [bacterium]